MAQTNSPQFYKKLSDFLKLYEEREQYQNIRLNTKRDIAKILKSVLPKNIEELSQCKDKAKREIKIEKYFQSIKKVYIDKYTGQYFNNDDTATLNTELTKLKDATIDFLNIGYTSDEIEKNQLELNPSYSLNIMETYFLNIQERTIAFFIEHATNPNIKSDNIFELWSDYIAKSPKNSVVGVFWKGLEHLDSPSKQEIANHLTKIHQETSRWQFSDPKTRGPLSIILVPLVEAFVHFLSNFFTIKNPRQEEQLKEPGNVPELINKIRPKNSQT